MCSSHLTIADLSLVVPALSSVIFAGSSMKMVEELEKDKRHKTFPVNIRDWDELRDCYMDMVVDTFQAKMNKDGYDPLPDNDQIKASLARRVASMFRIDDLHLCSLIELGQIEVIWTADLTQHLNLIIYSNGGHRSLSLYWFRADRDSGEAYYLSRYGSPSLYSASC